MTDSLFEQHRQTLDDAVRAINERTFHSAYPEVPSGKIYGQTAREDGHAAFKNTCNSSFDLGQERDSEVGGEVSPYGFDLDIRYPARSTDGLFAAANKAKQSWAESCPATRIGVCLEILKRLNARSFEMAFAVMHTTGQGFMMAFQAGGPHAQDRGLEAVAYAWQAMTNMPYKVDWSKRVSKTDTVTLAKKFHILPCGVGVTIGCSTFPTWNTYPSLFANLATGNAVIIKPHPGAILPLAITAKIARDVLVEQGYDADVVQLAADDASNPITKELVEHPDANIIDYTGSSSFGDWIEQNAGQAQVFTEKAGVNSIVIDSLTDLRGVTGNLAFSMSLYSGQMCTTPQNIFIPRDGVMVDGEHMSFDDVTGAIVKAVNWLLGEPARGAEILGAVQNPATAERIATVQSEGGDVLRESTPVENEHFPKARVHSPLMLKVDASDEQLYKREVFGPVVYFIATDDTDQSIALATACARELGAISGGLYSTDDDVIAKAERAFVRTGTPLSCNLVGNIYVNQSAAFSDFHVSGANPSGNATLCDLAFVASRFHVIQSRVLTPQPASEEAPAHAGV